MPKNKNLLTRKKTVVFLDFKPAELKENIRWEVVYYAKHPITKEFKRFRVAVPHNKLVSERRKLANRIIDEINKKLSSGWLPFYDDATENYKTFEYCKQSFLKKTEIEVQKNNKRKDTLRTYKSFLTVLSAYIEEVEPITLVFELNKGFMVRYLDWIYFDRKNSARTYNNHLLFLNTFINYCVERGYYTYENFTKQIVKRKKETKIRKVFTPEVKEKVKKLKIIDNSFYTLCMATYYCFIRRTELTKLKVKDVYLINKCIIIDEKISKNKKTDTVTIPDAYLELLTEHLKNANNEDYLFSDDFKTGKKILAPKKISDTWNKCRKILKIENQYQFYSLKDTGITDLLNTGIPALKVRDQARHYDLKITESYVQRNVNCIDEIAKKFKEF